MKFIPRKARDDVNVSKEHVLVEAGTLLVGVGILLAMLVVFLIFVVEIALHFISEERELKMFGSWLPDDLVTVDISDPRLRKVEDITQRLARHWPDTKYEFRVEIDDSDIVNAFAFPGRLIVVSSGLLDLVESENELAFILGHELGHFYHRDHMRGVGRVVVIGMLFAALSGSEGGAQLGSSIANLTLRKFSRDQESNADEFGLSLVQSEYGHVADSWQFFAKIREYETRYDRLVNFAATHPMPDDRIEAIHELAAEKGWSEEGDIRAIDW